MFYVADLIAAGLVEDEVEALYVVPVELLMDYQPLPVEAPAVSRRPLTRCQRSA